MHLQSETYEDSLKQWRGRSKVFALKVQGLTYTLSVLLLLTTQVHAYKTILHLVQYINIVL